MRAYSVFALAYSVFALATVALAACGGDDGSGPGSATVEGSWSASVSNMTGGGATCSTTSPIQATLRQTGSTFTGSYSSGVLTCTTPTESFSASTGSGPVINGQVSGENVTFDLGTPAFHHTGILEGDVGYRRVAVRFRESTWSGYAERQLECNKAVTDHFG